MRSYSTEITKRKAADQICYELTATSFKDENGELLGIVEDLNDITDIKEKEKQLRDSEGKYRDLVENINEVIYSVNNDGIVTYISPAVESLTGYRPEEIIGIPFASFIHSEDLDKWKMIWLNSISEHNPPSEFRIPCKDRKSVWVRSHGKIIRNGSDITGLKGVLADITDRKTVEQKLKESEQRYRTTFENTGTAMMIIEEDTTISLVNKEFEEISGYTKNEVENQMSWTQLVHYEDLEMLKSYHQLRRKKFDQVPYKYEFRAVDKKGYIKNLYMTIGLIPGTKKSIASLIDITYYRRLNMLLKASSEINELVARGKNSEDVLRAVCKNLHIIYNSVFTLLGDDSENLKPLKHHMETANIDKVIHNCPSVQKAMKGETIKVELGSDQCKSCVDTPHKYTVSLPLVHKKMYGIITIQSIYDFDDDEIVLLNKLSSNIAFALNAYEIEKKNKVAMEQLAANLTQFDRSADRLRNPLAVIMSSLELIDIYGEDRVIEIVDEQTERIKQELDELRNEEFNTYELVKPFKLKEE